jgi:hypothetical protein
MLCCWVRKALTVSQAVLASCMMRPPEGGHYNSLNTVILIQWHSITSQNTWICSRTAIKTWDLTENVFSPKDTVGHDHSRNIQMPKQHCSFSPLSALHLQLHLPYQGICHPILNECSHPYFLRFNLLTALRNVTGPLALSTTSNSNDFNPSHKDNGYYTHKMSTSNTAQLFTHTHCLLR